MRRVVGLTREQLELRERVLESLVAKALRQTVRSLSLRPLTAAGEPPTVSTTAASTGQVTATLPPLELAALPTTWSSYVAGELYPFLVETYLEAAELTAQAAEQAAGVTLERLTTGAAEAYLAGAKNRLAGIGDDLWNVVRDQLAEGYAAGESVHQLAARVRQTADVTEPRAQTIARSEVIPATNAASVEQLQLAFTDDECSKEWLATSDDRTRKAHREADGQRVGIHQAFDVDDEPLPYPGWPFGTPDNVINCRCSVAFVFTDDGDDDSDGEEDLSESLVAAGWTAEDERKRQRDAHGRFAKKVESPLSVSGPRRSKKLKDVLAADTGDSDELDEDVAADLRGAFTGKFHDLRTEVTEVTPGKKAGSVKVAGLVFDAWGDEVGGFTRIIRRRKNGELEAEHASLMLDSTVQGQGFAHAFNREMFDWYRENDVKRVVLLADIDVGGYAWARAGYDWKPDDVDGLLEIQNRIHEARLTDSEILNRVPPERREEQRLLARELFRDLDGTVTEDTDPDDELPDIIEMWPTPYELSQLGRWPGAGRDDWWVGKSIMMDSNWWGVLYLDDDVDA